MGSGVVEAYVGQRGVRSSNMPTYLACSSNALFAAHYQGLRRRVAESLKPQGYLMVPWGDLRVPEPWGYMVVSGHLPHTTSRKGNTQGEGASACHTQLEEVSETQAIAG